MNGFGLFCRFNAWAFCYVVGGPFVGYIIGSIAARYVPWLLWFDLIICSAYAWWFATESFRSYHERVDMYRRLRAIYLTHSEIKKSMLWSLKQKPCGDLVVRELEKEFGRLL